MLYGVDANCNICCERDGAASCGTRRGCCLDVYECFDLCGYVLMAVLRDGLLSRAEIPVVVASVVFACTKRADEQW